MTRVVEEVAVKVTADTRELAKGMKKAERGVKKLIGGFKKLAGVIGITFGARAAFRSFTRSLNTTDQLIKTAKGVGFLASEYRELTFAMNQVGVRSHSALIALGDFQKRLGKAVAGTSPQFAKAFRDAGLDPGALSKMDPAEAFDAALNRLASLKGDPRLAGLTGAVFEEQSGKDILKIIRQWEAFTDARVKHANKVSGLDKDQQFRIEYLSEEVGVYKAQWDTLKSKIVADAVPSILTAFEAMDDAGAFTAMGDAVVFTAEAFGKLTIGVTKFAEAWARGDDVFGGPLSPFRGGLSTPAGHETPDEAAKRFALAASVRNAPRLVAERAAAQQEARMSFEVMVTGDTPNHRALAEKIAREAERRAGLNQ